MRIVKRLRVVQRVSLSPTVGGFLALRMRFAQPPPPPGPVVLLSLLPYLSPCPCLRRVNVCVCTRTGHTTERTAKALANGTHLQEDTSCLVVGVHASSDLGYKENNRFGRLFKDAVENGVPDCVVESCVQGFSSNVLRITSGKFETFIDWLNHNLAPISN